MEWLALSLGLLLTLAGLWLLRRRPAARLAARLLRALATMLALVLGIMLLITGGTLYWYTHRPLPSPTRETLFEGVTYIRDVRREPRPLVIHVVQIDLRTPGLEFLVTPGEPTGGREMRARTTSQFADEFDLQLAVNGSWFEPFKTNSPWDYYPHTGDPVDVSGLACSRGACYSTDEPRFPVLYLSADNHAQFTPPAGAPYNAIAGNTVLLQARQTHGSGDAYLNELHPRTAAGIDQAGTTLILIVVDGRQPNYSEGVSMSELAGLLLEYGAYDAINLDGGGSTALVVRGSDGHAHALNSPIDNRIPGRERPVANHLGLRIRQ